MDFAARARGVLPTILDRLMSVDKPGEIGFQRLSGRIEESLMRDLEMLLNTRREELLVPSEFEETSKSIVNFGIPDLAACGSLRSGPEQAKLCGWIAEAIQIFEPRLSNISVRVIDRENVTPVLRLRVEAKAELTSERVAFALGLKRDSGVAALSRR